MTGVIVVMLLAVGVMLWAIDGKLQRIVEALEALVRRGEHK